MGLISSFVVLLVCSLPVDSGQQVEPIYKDQGNKISYIEGISPDSHCDSCLAVSKKAEKTLSDPNLFEEVDVLSSDVCRILPFPLRAKCLETSGAYLDRTRFFLQQLFQEENLCNDTGLCLDKSMFPNDDNLVTSVKSIIKEFIDERSCDACRKSVKDIIVHFQQSRMRMKVMDSLLEYCEEIEQNVDRCKQAVYKYAPVVLSKLNKMKTNDLCRLISLCDEGIAV